MSEREAVKEWLIANCLTCGKPFGQEEAWMENCPICFKESKGYKLLKGDLAFACLQEEVARLRAAKPNPARAPDNGDVERLREEIEDLAAKGMAAEARVEKLQKIRHKLKLKIDELEGEVVRLRHEISMKSPAAGPAQELDLPLLRKLLLLCHPDKNPNNLALATEVTQWLLNQKSKINP